MTDPGWYPDPQTSGQLRWWDGSTWTAHVATPTGEVPPAAAAPHHAGPGFGPGGPASSPGPAPGSGPIPASTNRRGLIIGLVVAGVGVLIVIALALPFLVGRSSSTTTSAPTTPSTARSGGPTTTAASELTTNAERADIPVLDEEGFATHTHTLLHITVDGDEIVIPAGIGIDARSGQIAAVHTHEDTGVLHVESPHRNDVYAVGQFLQLWGIADSEEELSANLTDGPCTVTVDVVAPTAADEEAFEAYGPMPATPPIEPDGLDTELAQGAVIEIRLETSA